MASAPYRSRGPPPLPPDLNFLDPRRWIQNFQCMSPPRLSQEVFVIRISRSSLVALILAGLVACHDESTSPTMQPAGAPTASVSSSRHIVMFKNNNIPTDFASRVAALG